MITKNRNSHVYQSGHVLPPRSTIRAIFGGCLALCAMLIAGGALAADIFKADNSDDLNQQTSWTGGIVPTAADVAAWDGTVTAARVNLLAVSTNWAGLKITNPGGAVTINSTSTNATAGATLTLGASGLDMSGASQDLTLGAPVSLLGSAAQTWTVGSGRTITLSGVLTRNARATLNVDNSAGGMLNVASGTVSNLLNYVTLNKTDFAALDSSRNIVPGVTIAAYTPNPVGTTANSASMSGTVAWVDVINSNPTIAPSAFRLSNTLSVTGGIRFDTPNTLGVDWIIDANTRNLNFGGACLLITPNVGAHNVIEQDSNTGFRMSGGSEMIVAQHNPSGDFILNGHASSSSGNVNITKTGVGRFIINTPAANNTIALTVEQGTALVNSSIPGASTVNSGATLGGSGRLGGAVTVNSGATIAAGGADGAGILTVGGALTLGAGTTFMTFYGPNVPTTNTSALLNLTNNFTVNGAVSVSILSGGAAVGQYPLIKWTNAVSAAAFANFSLISLPPHVVASLSNNTANSSIDLVISTVNEPLFWHAGNAAWDINATANWTNAAGATTYQQVGLLGDSVVFDDTATGSSPIGVALNVNVTPASVTVNNATKAYFISGTGAIGGACGLTKQGAAALTLSTLNTFTGGINLNGGTVNFSTLNNLGAGAITFGGGALAFAAGNMEDISVRTVTLAAGGGTLDDGGQTISFANPIGNSGAGGLTKAGIGTLTLGGTNRYSGNTVIGSGTLALASSAAIPNSAAIVIRSAATLDVSANTAITLSASAGQILAGVGTVNGGVTVPSGTTITPATNGTAGTLTLNSGDLTISGGTFACDVSASTRDTIQVNGNLNLNTGTIQLNVSGTLANGSYKLLGYSGVLSGSAGNLTLTGFSQAGKAAALSDAVANEIDLVISDTATDVITWAGVGADWDLAGSLNWLNSAAAWAFTNGDFVTFNDIGAAYPNVSLKAAVSPATITVTSDSTFYSFDDGTFIGGGKVTGPAVLTKNGAGILTINTVNDNTGATVINGGTVSVVGSIGSGYITNNGSLIFSQNLPRAVTGISGSGSLEQAGTSVLTLAGNNDGFSGSVTITSGTLQVGAGGTTGSLGSGPTVTDNGTLTINKTGTFSVTNAIAGSGGLVKSAAGIVTLTASNSYSGTTTINDGKLILGSATAHAGNGVLTVQTAGTNDLGGYDMTITRLSSSNPASTAGGRIVNNSGAGTNVLTINNENTITYGDNAVTIADNDGSGGKIRVVKNGAGTEMMRGASTYSGGTIINAGLLQARQQNSAFGAGANVILNGGTLGNYGSTLSYTIQTLADSGLENGANSFFNGPLIGTHNLDVTIEGGVTSGIVMSWGGANQMTNFSGRFVINGLSIYGNTWRWTANPNGSASAVFYLSNNVGMACNGSGYTISLGALEGATNTSVWGYPTTYLVGGKNTSTTYSGTVGGSGSFVKVGTGLLTLDGVYSFSGSTVVSNGVLALLSLANPTNSVTIRPVAGSVLDVRGLGYGVTETNEFGEITNSYVVTTSTLVVGELVAQTLSGAGSVWGNVLATNNGIVAPGDSIGTLTITNALTLAGATVNMELNRTNTPAINDLVAARSITVNGGRLDVTNVGPALYTGQSFKLFSQPVTGSGFTTVNLPVSDGPVTYTWANRLAIDGTIEVLSGASPIDTTPTNITAVYSGGTLQLSWPPGHTGWELQTNSVGVADPNSWFLYPGSASTNQVTITVDPAQRNVFYRLHLQYTP